MYERVESSSPREKIRSKAGYLRNLFAILFTMDHLMSGNLLEASC